MASRDGKMCDNHSEGLWRYKNRTDEIWGAKYRIGQYPHSLGQFNTVIEAMKAYDDVALPAKKQTWHRGHFTPWGRQKIDINPGITAEQIAKYDRRYFSVEWVSWFGYDVRLREDEATVKGRRYLTELGFWAATLSEQEMLRECLAWDSGEDQPDD